MRKYNPMSGVPRFSYFLVETTQFADFETEKKEQIIFISRNKQELFDLCLKNNWPCYECNNASNGWATHRIEYRGLW